ncbi:MAG: hypothetical protein PHE83_17970 [Opitutaceae bacterium]|nr:hypothetical protein [Opitutaceae bacterium]
MTPDFWTDTLPALYAGDLPPRVGDIVACADTRHVVGVVVAEATIGTRANPQHGYRVRLADGRETLIADGDVLFVAPVEWEEA